MLLAHWVVAHRHMTPGTEVTLGCPEGLAEQHKLVLLGCCSNVLKICIHVTLYTGMQNFNEVKILSVIQNFFQ